MAYSDLSPTEKAAYMRDYRARKALAAAIPGSGDPTRADPEREDPPARASGESPHAPVVERASVPSRAAPAGRKPSGYRCECEPGLPCIGHGIAKLSSERITTILARITRVAPRGTPT